MEKENIKILIVIILGLALFPALYLIQNINAEEGFQEGVIYESPYGTVRFEDITGNRRQLFINGGVMGVIDLNNKLDDWEYPSCMANLTLFNSPENTLVLGTGAGMLVRRLEGKTIIDTVEINPKVIEIINEYFYVKPKQDLNIFVDDARMFMKYNVKDYDIISQDTFQYIQGDYQIPVHLVTKEYFKLVKDRLTDEGVFIIMVTPKENKEDEIYNRIYNTIGSVFGNVYSMRCGAEIIIASDKELEFNNTYEYKPFNDLIYTDDYVPIY